MKVSNTSYGDEIEILASNDYQAIPIKVSEIDTVVKAGTPLTKAGLKALDGANAVGILLHSVDTSLNPNGALVVEGVIDYKKIKEYAGVTATAADLHDAIPAIYFREDITVQEG
ncbi:MAG: hypothetical protein ACI4I6_09555 [Hominimerdicola sp.]